MGWYNANFDLQRAVQGHFQITMSPHSDLISDDAAQRPLPQSLQLITFSHGLDQFNFYHDLNGVATSSVPRNTASDVGSIIEESQADEGYMITQNEDTSSNAK